MEVIKQNKEKVIQVRSIFLVSYLIFRGFQIEKIETDKLSRKVFYFKNDPSIIQAENDFISDEKIQEFITSYKIVKGLLYEPEKLNIFIKGGTNGQKDKFNDKPR